MESNPTETVYLETVFPPEQIFVQTNLFTTNLLSTFFCSQVKNQVLGIQNNISEDLLLITKFVFIPLYFRMKNQFKIWKEKVR
jgi:hypothetical protein